jgi:hypothetical protein
VKEFNARLAELERQVDSSIAYDAAENRVSALGYYLDDSMGSSPTIHQIVQPVIRITSDGKTAKIRARLLKVGATAGGGFAGGTYEGRAINSGNGWTLSDLTLKPSWSSPFAKWTPVFAQR